MVASPLPSVSPPTERAEEIGKNETGKERWENKEKRNLKEQRGGGGGLFWAFLSPYDGGLSCPPVYSSSPHFKVLLCCVPFFLPPFPSARLSYNRWQRRGRDDAFYSERRDPPLGSNVREGGLFLEAAASIL